MGNVASGATLRKFFFSYTLHLTVIMTFPLLTGLLILSLSMYYSSYFFLEASLLETLGDNASAEYLLGIILAVISLISVVFVISVILSSYIYAKNQFLIYAEEYFSNSIYDNPFRSIEKHQNQIGKNYSSKPPSPPQSFVAQQSQEGPLAKRYSDSSDRARWGPK